MIRSFFSALCLTVLIATAGQAQEAKSLEDYKWFFDEFYAQTFYEDPAFFAAKKGYLTVVQFLVDAVGPEKKVDRITAEDGEGWTLLMEAAYGGHVDLTRYLVESLPGADKSRYVRHQSKDGSTALIVASMAEEDLPEVSKYLVESLSEEEKVPYLMETRRNDAHALSIALVNKNVEIAKYLIDVMPQKYMEDYLFAQDDRGRTPLIWASAMGLLDAVKYLMEALPEERRAEYAAVTSDSGWDAMKFGTGAIRHYLKTIR